MFESVAPEAFAKRRRRLSYAVLPLSLAIHGIGVAAALLGAIWTVVFPIHSPRLVTAYNLAAIPEPPPLPPPPLPARTPKPQPAAPPPPIEKIVAPVIIPDTIPQVPKLAAELAPPPATDTAPTAGGVPGGQAGGVPGGTGQGAPPLPSFPNDGRVHIARGENLPMETISQEFPAYPPDAKRLQLEDQVVIRYTIGKNGRVIDVQILSHANLASFDTAVLDAVRRWRFRPMVKNGKPVEVTQDLGINFVLVRH